MQAFEHARGCTHIICVCIFIYARMYLGACIYIHIYTYIYMYPHMVVFGDHLFQVDKVDTFGVGSQHSCIC